LQDGRGVVQDWDSIPTSTVSLLDLWDVDIWWSWEGLSKVRMASSSSSSAEEREDFTRMVDESVFLTGRLDPASEKDYVKVEALDLKKLEQFGADFLLEKGKGKAIASSKPSQSSEVSNPGMPSSSIRICICR